MSETKTEEKSVDVEKSLLQRPQWRWGAIVASGLNYAGPTLLMVFWKLDLVLYILFMLGVSFMIGVLLVEIEQTVLYSVLGLILGNAIAVAIFLAPYNMFGESVGEVNIATIVVLSLLAKHLLISIGPYTAGMIAGCFAGSRLNEA